MQISPIIISLRALQISPPSETLSHTSAKSPLLFGLEDEIKSLLKTVRDSYLHLYKSGDNCTTHNMMEKNKQKTNVPTQSTPEAQLKQRQRSR